MHHPLTMRFRGTDLGSVFVEMFSICVVQYKVQCKQDLEVGYECLLREAASFCRRTVAYCSLFSSCISVKNSSHGWCEVEGLS